MKPKLRRLTKNLLAAAHGHRILEAHDVNDPPILIAYVDVVAEIDLPILDDARLKHLPHLTQSVGLRRLQIG